MTRYLVGRGIADITGEAAGCGMLGYGKSDQKTEGIHTRLRSRAFAIIDRETDGRVLLIINDLPMVFTSIRQAVLARLTERFAGEYRADNVMITATHTHCGPGGYSHHLLYNTNTGGFRPATFAAIVDGMVEAAERAHADIGPADLCVAHGELHDASVNRSRPAFDRNPAADRAFFPNGNDPQTTVLRIAREDRLVGAVNWFATHNTSMTNTNRLISADNKGYAAYHWEREIAGIDYREDRTPALITAFAQTNAGDMSPNLELRPGTGPTGDELQNVRVIGLRQQAAAEALTSVPAPPLDGPVDARVTYIDWAATTVHAEFTGDGRAHRTSAAMGGAACLAGAWADGVAFPGFREGRNPLFDAISERFVYRRHPDLADAQAPKGIVLPGSVLNRSGRFLEDVAPVQLLRIGTLYLIGIPAEVTIVAGLRLRRAVATIVGAAVTDVLCAGYSNGYMHYVTTPEEYDAQRYEGGSTLFGRWELPALIQTVSDLAEAMRDGRTVSPGVLPIDLSARQLSFRRSRPKDRAPAGATLGDVLHQPRQRYRRGDTAVGEFAGAHPANDVRRGSTFLEVQRCAAGDWQTIADDGDWTTRFRWTPAGRGRSRITITWDIGPTAEAGEYRIRYCGDAVDRGGKTCAVTGVTRPFVVSDD